MDKNETEEIKDPRSVRMLRVGKVSEPVEDRMYQAELKGSPVSSIETLTKALKNRFDIVVLHDTIDECLILDVNTGEYGELPCRIHHAPNNGN